MSVNLDSNWVLVIITAVYVIATIAICVANFKSANASKKQLEEMRRQFEEEKRPHIETEIHFERRMCFVIRFINHGHSTAQNVKIKLDKKFIDSIPEQAFRELVDKQKDKICVIGVEQYYDLYIGSSKFRENKNWEPVTGKIQYQDKDRTYENDIYIDLENYMTFFSTNTEHEDIIKQLKETKDALRLIDNSIKSININQKEENNNA